MTTIYEILNETSEDTVFSSPEDIRGEVEMALSDQFGEGGSEHDTVVERFGGFPAFVDAVISKLVGMDCPEDEWGDGSVWSQIENVGFDELDGEPDGTAASEVKDILGEDPDGALKRLHGALFGDEP